MKLLTGKLVKERLLSNLFTIILLIYSSCKEEIKVDYYSNNNIKDISVLVNDTLKIYNFYENGVLSNVSYKVNDDFVGNSISYFPSGYTKQRILRSHNRNIRDFIEFDQSGKRLRESVNSRVIGEFEKDTVSLGDSVLFCCKFGNSMNSNSEFSIITKNQFYEFGDMELYYISQRMGFYKNNFSCTTVLPNKKGWNYFYFVGFDYETEYSDTLKRFSVARYKDSVFVK